MVVNATICQFPVHGDQGLHQSWCKRRVWWPDQTWSDLAAAHATSIEALRNEDKKIERYEPFLKHNIHWYFCPG